jgi:rod shape-determining protein MreC
MFARGPWLGLRLLVYLGLSIALMVFDHRNLCPPFLKKTLATLAYPIQYGVHLPIRFFSHIQVLFVNRYQLQQENVLLKGRVLQLQAEQNNLYALYQKNQELRKLLENAPHAQGRVLITQIISVPNNPYKAEVVIDKGLNAQVYQNQPVLDVDGLLGQVITIGPVNAKVMLIADLRSAIPVQSTHSGLRAIAVGNGADGTLSLINIAQAAHIQIGEQWITSGLGGHFPPGYPVGSVVAIQQNPAEAFSKIILTPSAHLNADDTALLVWPSVNPNQNTNLETPIIDFFEQLPKLKAKHA